MDDDLQFLTRWGAEDRKAHTRRPWVVSAAVHVVGITTLLLLPKSVTTPPPRHETHQVTPLIAPLTELTQTAPNKGKVSKEFNADAVLPRPRIQIPPSIASTTRPAAPRPAPERKAAPPPNLPEPPKVEEAKTEAPKLPSQQIAQAPPPPLPQIQAQEQKPKLELQNVAPPPSSGTATGKVQVPNTSVQDAIRSVARGSASGGLVVGDTGIGSGGIGEGINLPPAPGRTASNIELKSDPMGVDFRPYLIQVLAAVKRNWFAVMPESAKMGRQGKVAILFSIGRQGGVIKLAISGSSGIDAFDRAAVAGISASNPFPALPTEFKGDRVILQFNFAYNVPVR